MFLRFPSSFSGLVRWTEKRDIISSFSTRQAFKDVREGIITNVSLVWFERTSCSYWTKGEPLTRGSDGFKASRVSLEMSNDSSFESSGRVLDDFKSLEIQLLIGRYSWNKRIPNEMWVNDLL